MTLQKQNAPISFAQGVDTKTDPKQVVAGKLLSLQNGVFQTSGEIRKRNGYTALTQSILGGSTISAAVGLASFKSELTLADGTALRSYSPSAAGWSSPVGTYQPCGVSTLSVYKSSATQSTQDSAYHAASGLQAFVWEDTTGASLYSIVDSVTGQSIVAGQILNTPNGISPKVLTLGSYFVFVYVDTGAPKIRYQTVSVSTPTVLSAAVDVATNLNSTNKLYDATIIDQRLFIAYNNTAGGGGISLKYLTTGLVLSSELAVAGDAASGAITVFGDSSDNVWVGYYNGTSVKGFAYDYALATPVVTLKTVDTLASVRNLTGVIVGSSPTTARLYYEVSGSSAIQSLIGTNTFSTSGAGTATTQIRSLCLASKAVVYGGVPYFLGVFGSSVQPTYFLMRAGSGTSAVVVAKLAPEVGGGRTSRSVLPELNTFSSGIFQTTYLEKSQIIDTFGVLSTRVGVSSARLDLTATSFSLEAGGNLLLGGGILSLYDGANVVEYGFNVYPEILSTSQSGTGGNLSAGTYSYVAVYQWIDNQGQVHRSAPSPAVSVVVASGATNRITITVKSLNLTQKLPLSGISTGPVQVIFYRTAAGQTVYYDVGNSPYQNPTGDTTAINDGLADTTLTGGLQLYTTGGEVENFAPPATLALTTYKERVVLIPADNRQSWWYSKEIIPGFPVEFSDLFTQNMDARGGDLTAVAQMDDKLVLFKRRNVFIVVGDGPAPSGANNDFTPPQILPTDAGCTVAASVVLMRDGIMYQSEKGIYLLDRSLAAQYIGQDVESYNSDTVTSAKLIPNTTQVRFTMQSGVALVYDYDARQWSVFTNHAAVGATVFQNAYCFVKSNGQVLKETASLFTDDGAFVQLSLTTSWLQFAGLQGFQRVSKVLLLGEYKSAHTLQVQVAYDFDSTVVQTENVTASSSPPYQYRVDFARQKCEAVQLTIQDTQTPAYGEGLSLSSMAFEVAVKSGLNKMAQARTYG